MPTPSRAMSARRSRASNRTAHWRTWSIARRVTNIFVPAFGTTDLFRRSFPQHHVERALDDRLQLPTRRVRAGTDRNRMDGNRRQLRKHDRIGARGQLAGVLGAAEAEGERLVELAQRILHHGADVAVLARFGARGHHRETAARTILTRQIDIERGGEDALALPPH